MAWGRRQHGGGNIPPCRRGRTRTAMEADRPQRRRHREVTRDTCRLRSKAIDQASWPGQPREARRYSRWPISRATRAWTRCGVTCATRRFSKSTRGRAYGKKKTCTEAGGVSASVGVTASNIESVGGYPRAATKRKPRRWAGCSKESPRQLRMPGVWGSCCY